MPEASQPQSLKPKMVSIPVHFVGSERGRSDLAIKIQKVFRGFLVRKNVKKIMAIREQVNDIERSVSKTETRLKVNENLMSLLFKLDSVKGVDSCVRDFRKSVIKKTIALQEMVDAIISGNQSVDSSNNAEVIDQNQGIIDSSDKSNQILEWEATEDAECVANLSESEGSFTVAVGGNEEKILESSGNESQSNWLGDEEGENRRGQSDNCSLLFSDNRRGQSQSNCSLLFQKIKNESLYTHPRISCLISNIIFWHHISHVL
ncbi:hypothetical protein ES332_D10G305000v1, partial [Gossypium tomentosum]